MGGRGCHPIARQDTAANCSEPAEHTVTHYRHMFANTATLLQLLVLGVGSINVSYETPDGRFSVIPDGSNFVKFQVPKLKYVRNTNLLQEGVVALADRVP